MAVLIKFIASPGAAVQSRAQEDDITLGEFLEDAVGSTTGFDVAVNGNPTANMSMTLANEATVSITPKKLASAA